MLKQVLGVKIDDISLKEALTIVTTWLGKNHSLKKNDSLLKQRIIVTPGPEFLLTAQKDLKFREILKEADLSLPDGFGLQLFCGFKNRVPGTDFMLALCQLSAKNNWTVGLMGGQAGVAKRAAENLGKKISGIKIAAAIDGAEADEVLNGYYSQSFLKQSFDILFLAFGHPKQEKLLNKLKNDKINFKVGMGVGGAFDYIAGVYPRPPKIVQVIGLEWLWRLVTQPDRVKRIFKATIVFPLRLLLS